MLGNHDILRKNKANKALQGSIFANIGSTSLKSLEKFIKSENFTNEDVDKPLKLIQLASECNDRMLNLFNESQQAMGKYIAKTYATDQHNRMLDAIKNKEIIENMIDISPYVYNEDIVRMYKELDVVDRSECK